MLSGSVPSIEPSGSPPTSSAKTIREGERGVRVLELLAVVLAGGVAEGATYTIRLGDAPFITAGGTWVRAGVVAELDPRVIEAFEGRAERGAYAEVSLDAIFAAVPASRRARELPRQPAVERDLAVVVPVAIYVLFDATLNVPLPRGFFR